MNEPNKDKIVGLIGSLKVTIDELCDYERQENEPLKKLPYPKLADPDIKTMILGKNITDLCHARSKIFEALHYLEEIICREVTE